ncbi:MAG: hypothetical protein V4684_04365 [Pseudomonadota bacterium]
MKSNPGAPAKAALIVSARITAMPEHLGDPMPEVIVIDSEGQETKVFSYFPDELTFQPKEFIGLTLAQARQLKFTKDRAYLRS